jgi:hypothetical protein
MRRRPAGASRSPVARLSRHAPLAQCADHPQRGALFAAVLGWRRRQPGTAGAVGRRRRGRRQRRVGHDGNAPAPGARIRHPLPRGVRHRMAAPAPRLAGHRRLPAHAGVRPEKSPLRPLAGGGCDRAGRRGAARLCLVHRQGRLRPMPRRPAAFRPGISRAGGAAPCPVRQQPAGADHGALAEPAARGFRGAVPEQRRRPGAGLPDPQPGGCRPLPHAVAARIALHGALHA